MTEFGHGAAGRSPTGSRGSIPATKTCNAYLGRRTRDRGHEGSYGAALWASHRG